MCLRWVFLLTLGLLSASISTATDCKEAARSTSGPTIGLNAAGPSVTVDLACHFTSATSSETFTVSSSDALTVAASLNGTLLTLDPGHVRNTTPATATVTVKRGSESYAIDVVVSSCLTAADAALLPRLVVNRDQVMTWDLNLSDQFVKTGGGALMYDARSSNTDTFTVSLSNSRLTITGGRLPNGKDRARAELILTARNDCGVTRVKKPVTLEGVNKAPTIDTPLGAKTLASHGYTTSYALSDHFSDLDFERLTYSQASSDTATVRGGFSYHGTLTVTTQEVSQTTKDSIFVMAIDPIGLAARDTLVVTVEPNVAPVVDEPIPDATLASHGYTTEYTLSEHFRDPDGTPADLTYGNPSSTVSNVATATVSGDELTVTSGSETGTAGISVTATDTGGLEFSATFDVTVTQNQSPTVAIPFGNIEMKSRDNGFDIGLAGRFSDPEGGPLTFSVGVDASGSWRRELTAVTAEITGNTLTVTPQQAGLATVMVTAYDIGRRSVRDDFVVRVTAGKRSNPDSVNVRSAPAPVGSIPDQALTIVGSAVRIDVAPFFMESDGDAVMYSARLAIEAERIPDYVSVEMSGSMLTLTPGTTSGRIDVLVSATDIDGTASQTFTVNVADAN